MFWRQPVVRPGAMTRFLNQIAVLVHLDHSHPGMAVGQNLIDALAGADARADAAVAVAAGEQAQIVLDQMVHGTAVALQDDHATVVGLLADGLRVPGVAQLAPIHQFHAALHSSESFQCGGR